MTKHILRITTLLCLAISLASCSRASDPAETEGSTLTSDFQNAIALKAKGSNGAAAQFSQTALGFEALAEKDGRWWYNAGTSRWWAGQGALAVLDFRHALEDNYLSAKAWDNLEEARKLAGTAAPGGEGLLASPWPLWCLYGAALALNLAALSAGAWCWTRRRIFRNGLAGSAAAILVCCAAAGITLLVRPTIGVVAIETQGYKGDASVYARQPETPWKAGQEVWIEEKRDNWVRITVQGQESWVPAASLWIPR